MQRQAELDRAAAAALWLLLAGLLFVIGLLLVAWAAGAIYFDLPASAPVRNAAAIFWVVAAALPGCSAVLAEESSFWSPLLEFWPGG
jgi:hypothetical protein